jgi:hypothetical protein
VEVAQPIAVLTPGELGDPGPLGVGDDNEDPGIEEFYEIETPELAAAVEAISNLPTDVRSLIANVDGTGQRMGKGRGLGRKGGGGGGTGGKQAERWSIEYEAANMGEYFRQLSFFGIEIGFVSKITDKVEIVSSLTATPQTRVSNRREERRTYFIHTNSKLKNWDTRIAVDAGVKPEAKIMVQFYPPPIAKQLAEMEAAAAAQRQLDPNTQIRRTVFKVRPAGPGFEYYVADIVPK